MSEWSSAEVPNLDKPIVAVFVVVVTDVGEGWHVNIDAVVDVDAGWAALRFAVVSEVEAFFSEGGPSL